jgi:hypothetical protein
MQRLCAACCLPVFAACKLCASASLQFLMEYQDQYMFNEVPSGIEDMETTAAQ